MSTASAMGAQMERATASPSTNEAQRVKVFVRLKPHLESDGALLPPCVAVDTPKSIQAPTLSTRLLLEKPSRQGDASTTRPYTFDGILDQSATQADVYREVAEPIVHDVLNGYNGTILAYGQTGAGKTHTLSSIKPESIGIIPRAAQDLFASIEGRRGICGNDVCDVEVKLSYLQIYCEQIQDLLKPETGDNLSIRELKDGGSARVGVPDLQEMVVTSLDDCLRLIQLGDRNRSVAFTALNAHSSRSHAVVIFTVTTRQREPLGGRSGSNTCPSHEESGESERRRARSGGNDVGHLGDLRHTCTRQRTGRLYLVDLAGSERLKKSKSVDQRAVEARSINLSLTTLGKCVNARATGQMHVPFRDSKLTRLLQESLGGNAKTSMIVAVRGDGDHAEETYQSLEFGSRAMHVETHAEVNVDEVLLGAAGSSMGGAFSPNATSAMHAFAKLQHDAQMIKELKKDQDRSLRAIRSLEKEKEAMLREARKLKDAHEEQLGVERSEKDEYRTRALQAERRAMEAELLASRNESKVVELREQLDRAMEQLEVLDALEDDRTARERKHDKELESEADRRRAEDEARRQADAAKLEALQVDYNTLEAAHADLEKELATARREITKYKKRAKEAVFKLNILTKHHKRNEVRTKAAITIQRAYRAHRARQQRAKVQDLVRTKDALRNLAAKHAAGERILGESLQVVHEAVEGILSTFLLKGEKLDPHEATNINSTTTTTTKATNTTTTPASDLIPAARHVEL